MNDHVQPTLESQQADAPVAQAPVRRGRPSKRDEIRQTLRELLRRTWRPLWRSNARNFARAWQALALGALLAFGQSRAAAAVPPAPLAAVSAVVSGSTLIVSGTPDADTISVTSVGGNVKVNDVDPSTGSFASANLSVIQITGDDGADVIDLAGVVAPNFSLNGLSIEAGAGNDVLIYSPDQAGTLNGGADSDILRVTADGEILLSGQGSLSINNILSVGNGFEQAQLFGGGGNGTISAENASIPVTINGGVGDDTLRGGPEADSFFASVGSDSIIAASAGQGDSLSLTADANITLTDTLLSWSGNSTSINGSFAEVSLNGGAGANTISATGYSGPVTMSGLGGSDTLTGGAGNDTLDGGDGNDSLNGKAGADAYLASTGSDVLGGASAGEGDTLALTADANITLTNQLLSWAGNSSVLNGSFAEAFLTGGAGANSIDASTYSGKLLLKGLAGNDTLTGGSANDRIEGGDGNDTLSGGDGDDTIVGGAGDDLIDGKGGSATGAGATLSASDNDNLDGGADRDTLRQTADANQTLTNSQATGSGTDTLSNFEAAELTGGAGANVIDASAFSGPVTLRGLGGNDTLTGGNADDLIDGGAGNDNLNGGPGNDTLLGGDGDDNLVGGPGRDTLNGGAGANTFDEYKLHLPLLKR